MVSEQGGNTCIVCWMSRASGSVVNWFLRIIRVNIGDVQNKGVNLMKFRILLFTLVFVFVISVLTGCSQVVSREVLQVEAFIVEADYDPFIRVGSVYSGPDYDILVRYGGKEIWIDVSRQVYYQYKDRVGCTVEMYHVTDKYDNGLISQYLEFPK